MVDELPEIGIKAAVISLSSSGVGLGLRSRGGLLRRGHLLGQLSQVMPVDRIAVFRQQPGKAARHHLLELIVLMQVPPRAVVQPGSSRSRVRAA